jgi:Protein of unknown function (DUF2845)
MHRLVVVLLLMLAAGSAQADAMPMQCGSALVSTGDTPEQVLAKCGNPAEVQRGTVFVPPMAWVNGVPVSAGTTLIEVPLELWLYNFGPTQPMRRIRFESGRVVGIEVLGYGYAAEGR